MNHDIWSRNQMKVMHKKIHISNSIIEVEKNIAKKSDNFFFTNPKIRNRMGLANQ